MGGRWVRGTEVDRWVGEGGEVDRWVGERRAVGGREVSRA